MPARRTLRFVLFGLFGVSLVGWTFILAWGLGLLFVLSPSWIAAMNVASALTGLALTILTTTMVRVSFGRSEHGRRYAKSGGGRLAIYVLMPIMVFAGHYSAMMLVWPMTKSLVVGETVVFGIAPQPHMAQQTGALGTPLNAIPR